MEWDVISRCTRTDRNLHHIDDRGPHTATTETDRENRRLDSEASVLLAILPAVEEVIAHGTLGVLSFVTFPASCALLVAGLLLTGRS